ncbi:MAG: hypothetical protein ABIT38_08880 [Gemmatimonadaceae bacterium]
MNSAFSTHCLTPTRRASRAWPVLVLAIVVACVSTSTRSYLPSPRNPSYAPKDAEQALRQYVQLQCAPRAAAKRADTGSAAFMVEIDSAGHASRAELRRSSSDEELDGLFGTVVAQLNFAADSAYARLIKAGRTPVSIDFHCTGDSAAVKLAIGAQS